VVQGLQLSSGGQGVLSYAELVLLRHLADKTGLAGGLSRGAGHAAGLGPWPRSGAGRPGVHDRAIADRDRCPDRVIHRRRAPSAWRTGRQPQAAIT